MIKRNIKFLLLLLFLADTGYSFNQHYHVNLDGDMAWIIVPATGYQQVRKDPLGLGVLLYNKTYASPNRYCAHWTMSQYFKNAPKIIQLIFSPINSVYIACALAKTSIQVLIICLLAAFICATTSIFKKEFLLAALIITPLFQASGYTRTLGVIDLATTYTFFYALPLGLLLCFFYPFYKATTNGRQLNLSIYHKVFLLLLLLLLPLNGPLVAAVVLIVCPTALLYMWFHHFKASSHLPFFQRSISAITRINGSYLFFFIIFIILCLYSLYIGRNDAENLNTIPLLERYRRLPLGLFNLMTNEFGFPLLLSVIALNSIIIYKSQPTKERLLILNLLKLIGLFATIYLLLLPLGGYRPYRPNIVRQDTFMPITLCLMFFYGLSTYYLLKQLKSKTKTVYASVIILASVIFTLADRPIHGNDCEKEALREISQSTKKIVPLDCNCSVMSWNKISNYEDSKWNTNLLLHWGIIKEEKFYYNK